MFGFNKKIENLNDLLERIQLEKFTAERSNKVLNEKINLILNHLELEYVPEKDTKEPAKLKKINVITVKDGFFIASSTPWITYRGGTPIDTATPPKRKLGRPKKK